jgi:hypothetical protein
VSQLQLEMFPRWGSVPPPPPVPWLPAVPTVTIPPLPLVFCPPVPRIEKPPPPPEPEEVPASGGATGVHAPIMHS